MKKPQAVNFARELRRAARAAGNAANARIGTVHFTYYPANDLTRIDGPNGRTLSIPGSALDSPPAKEEPA